MQKYLPYAVLIGLGCLAFTVEGELLGALVITLAFAVGWLQATGRLFGRSPEDRDRAGRAVLRQMTPADIQSVLARLDVGERIGALARIREITDAGLNDAKDALALLSRRGARWNEEEDLTQ